MSDALAEIFAHAYTIKSNRSAEGSGRLFSKLKTHFEAPEVLGRELLGCEVDVIKRYLLFNLQEEELGAGSILRGLVWEELARIQILGNNGEGEKSIASALGGRRR